MRSAPHTSVSLARTLKLQQFSVFEKVLEAGTIVAASRELAMTQSAVTKSIQELERHLGESLFLRSKQGVTLTPFGVAFQYHAKSMTTELRRLANRLDAWHSGSAGRIAAGTLLTASTTLLPHAIARLREVAPDIDIDVRVGTSASLFPVLTRGELDVVVGYLPAPGSQRSLHANLTHVKLYDEPLCAVASSNHPMARRKKLSIQDLYDLEWIIPTPDSIAYATVCEVFEARSLAMPSHVVHSVSILTNIDLLRRRPMVALMPQSALKPFIEAGFVCKLPLGELGQFGTVGYTLHADRHQSEALHQFLLALHEASEEASTFASDHRTVVTRAKK